MKEVHGVLLGTMSARRNDVAKLEETPLSKMST